MNNQFSTEAPDTESDWRESANCAGIHVDMFFPEKGSLPYGVREVCGNCDVQAQCLQYALDNGERYGIWGGMSETKRRTMKRNRSQPKPIAHGTEAGAATHRRRGETPCGPCLQGAARAQFMRRQS
jgi:WhiB family transcriptional regulator, redox-sensing transcriptional regulator